MKILFVVADMDGYGAQRVMVNLVSRIERERFSPVLVLSKKKGAFLDDLPGDIPVYDLGRRNVYDFPKLVFKLAAIIFREKPDIVFSALFHANILLLAAKCVFGLPCKIIISEHISQAGYNNFIYKWLIKKLYPKASLIIAVSEGVKNDLLKILKIQPQKIKVIYNPVDIDRINILANEAVNDMAFGDYPLIVNIGRLSGQKGHAMLLEAFSIVRKQAPSRLMIIGGGEGSRKLKNLAIDLKIEEDVFFKGYQKNPYKYLSRASIFINSSLYEGFGCVIVEAMACGIPVVSTACPHGPSEIIKDNENGYLVAVADQKAMAAAIIKLLEDKELRMKFSVEGKKRAGDFSVSKIVREYENVFAEKI